MADITKYVISGILGLIGLFYAALPHSVHISSGIGLGLSHTVHMIIGAVLIIAAIVVFMAARKS